MPSTHRRSTSYSQQFSPYFKTVKTSSRRKPTFGGHRRPPVHVYLPTDLPPAALGGFCDVYKLRVPHYGCIAVKRPRFNEYDREERRRMLVNEGKILAMIDHPNILPFIDIRGIGGRECIISPWATNGSLNLYLQRNPEACRLLLMHQVASALNYLHTSMKNPIIHGDISIDNVLVSADGTALLSDFGFSGMISRDDDTPIPPVAFELHPGRAEYDAPELYVGATRSRPTDIFAFGMLMFRVYAGKPPFAWAHRGAIAYAITVMAIHRGDRPRRREITRTDFPEGLWQLMERCWDHWAEQRPSASEVLHQLDYFLADSS